MTDAKAIFFDLDDTLAAPHHKLEPEMSQALQNLMQRMPVALATAAPFSRIERDFFGSFPPGTDFKNLYIFSESGGQCRTWNGAGWDTAYAESITEEERQTIKNAINESIEESGVLSGLPVFGPRLIDREAGVTLSTLGSGAPQEEREKWDPSKEKREILREAIVRRLGSKWEVFIGGLTSIDITHDHVNKTMAVEWMAKHLSIPPSEMLYIADSLYEGGNDHCVIATGIQTRPTTGPTETLTMVASL